MPTQAQIDAIMDRTKADLDRLFAVTPPPTSTVKSNLQLAIDKAQDGAILQLDPSLHEPNPIAVTRPITLLGRSDPTGQMPQIRGGMDIAVPRVTLQGIEIHKDQQRNDVLVILGDSVTLTDVSVLGDPVKGQKRGILANAPNLTLRFVTVDHIWLSDQDSQALCGWDNTKNLLAENCYFSGAGETVLFGGADPLNATRRPANITFRKQCVLTKRLEWRTPQYQVKTTLELKNVSGFTMQDCEIRNAWQQAQDGYLIMLTPRNQDGHAPESAVEDVLIQRCTGGHASAFLALRGTDDEKPSGPLQRVKILGNTMSDFDPSVWRSGATWGSDKLMLVQAGPSDITIDGNTLSGVHHSSALYFDVLPQAQKFNLTNNTYEKTEYGIFGGDSSPSTAWAQYVASGLLQGNSER